MTDRELLELAAKAAGIEWLAFNESAEKRMYVHSLGAPGDARFWDPLHDDGDALRLAVRLRFEVDVYYGEVASGEEGDRRQTLIGDDTDRCAATRRAIVRSAAAMAERGER